METESIIALTQFDTVQGRESRHHGDEIASVRNVCYAAAMQQLVTESASQVVASASLKNAVDAERCRALMMRITDGDERALADLYDATVGRAYALALRITRNPQDAEDVVEETYFQIWQCADHYDAQRGSVLAWVLTICRSRALDKLRRRDRAESHADSGSLYESGAEHAPDPQQLVAMFQRDSAVHAALTQLTAVQQQLVALAFLRDMSHQQIAEHLNMPLGTVKTHIRKALTALQGVLKHVEIGAGE